MVLLSTLTSTPYLSLIIPLLKAWFPILPEHVSRLYNTVLAVKRDFPLSLSLSRSTPLGALQLDLTFRDIDPSICLIPRRCWTAVTLYSCNDPAILSLALFGDPPCRRRGVVTEGVSSCLISGGDQGVSRMQSYAYPAKPSSTF